MKTIIKIFICLSLIYTPMFANAANVGGWNLSNPIAQGASTVYDATKNVLINGKKFIKESSVKITPTASQVSKVLARGGAGYALSVAVEQLLGAVDWVLDPANNQIVYYKEPTSTDPQKNEQYMWKFDGSGVFTNLTLSYGLSADAVCNAVLSAHANKSPWFYDKVSVSRKSATSISCLVSSSKTSFNGTASVSRVANPAYDPNAQDERERKTLPLETVAQKVISNAEGGDINAQVATTPAAADIVAEAETDQSKARPIASQAEANAETKPADAAEAEKANEAQGESKPNTQNPEAMDISLEFPVFCSWAPTVCEAAQVVISFPQTLTEWWETANQKADDWATSISQAYQDFMRDDDLPNDDTKVDITDIPTPELQENAISWGAACPADVSIPISMQGVSSTLVFSWSPWCQLLSIIKPAIIASAYIGAAFIVLGLRT